MTKIITLAVLTLIFILLVIIDGRRKIKRNADKKPQIK